VAAFIGGLRSTRGTALALLAAGALAGALVIATEFAPVATVDVADGNCEVINDANPELADRCSLSGFERHGGALIVLGALAIAMAYGAGAGRSRPAAVALAAIGLIVLALALLRDLPRDGPHRGHRPPLRGRHRREGRRPVARAGGRGAGAWSGRNRPRAARARSLTGARLPANRWSQGARSEPGKEEGREACACR
jgi:hypothetical protein